MGMSRFGLLLSLGVAGIDRKLRDAIRSRLHGLVAATLILSVMVITVFSSIFITIQIIGESRIAVAKIDNVIRTSQEKADFGVGLVDGHSGQIE